MRRVSRSSAATLGAAASLCLAGWANPALAQSSVQVYGLVDISAGQFQTAGGLKVKRLDSGNMSTSYLGFKGTEDLGGGLRAGFTLDSFLLADSGGASRVPGVDAFWARNANVSLSGGFGNLRLGRMGPPLFVSTLLFNAFGDSFGYSPAIRQYYSAPYGTPLVGDSGWNNAIGYTTPRFGGLSANLMVAAGEGAATSKGRNVGANALYFAGPLGLTAAWQKVQSQGTLGRPISAFPGFSSQTSYQVGGSFDAGMVKFFAQYGRISTDATSDVKVTNTHFGASVPIGAGKLLAQYGQSKLDFLPPTADRTSKMLTLAYDYYLSKRTDLYALYMSDKYTGLSNGNTYAVGVRHTF
jgi:predicted porin